MIKLFKNIINSDTDDLSSHILSQKINKDGWVIINHYSEELITLVENICSNLELEISFHNYKKLIPRDNKEASYFSLSSAYGLNDFPLHTDGAEYKIPPKFLVLRALANSPTGTTIADAKTIQTNISACNSKWSVKTKDGIINTKLYETDNKYKIGYIRFNRLSMKCIEGDKVYVSKAIDNLSTKIINWTINKTIIIDNWRVLHGRQQIREDEYDKRIIERLQVFI